MCPGWSDQSLLKCGKFYPASVRSTEDRLRHYSTHFPCVEVDTSTYAIPSIASVKGWLQCVPKGFYFHFKAFGLFCSKSCSLTALPVHIRHKVSEICPGKDYIHLNDLSVSLRDELWQSFNKILYVAHGAGNLGLVVFQFHLSFKPTKENQAHVEWCRENLDPCFLMAAEFRCRDWFNNEWLTLTTKWLSSMGIILVAADELEHETFQKDREQTGLQKGQIKITLPVAWSLTNPDFMYVRVHRREGSQRLLSESELSCWVNRLTVELPQGLKGPIFFMWGTDWEDQPLINAKNLNAMIGDMAFNWKASQQLSGSRSMLSAYFGRKTKTEKCALVSKDFLPLCNEEQKELEHDCNSSQSSQKFEVSEFPGENVFLAPAILTANRKHIQDSPALLGCIKKTKYNDNNKPLESLKKTSSSITAYFQKR
ncbi:hypothetical protein KP509_04G082600 [Ceratopteris richardii]|uniref:Uncharacterized protein n=1 Tax=Ceratopteris richardii TaxID=49495 RepID=A0A8T2UUP2_CERRI|nr:hypothetical protein KP509_04G082600 [Ceratopteris richardii]